MENVELAPCALCLGVYEAPSMIEVQLPPGKGEPGPRRRLCSGCVSAIEAALPEGKRWESKSPKRERKASPKHGSKSRDGETPEPSPVSAGEPTDQISEGGEEVAKEA